MHVRSLMLEDGRHKGGKKKVKGNRKDTRLWWQGKGMHIGWGGEGWNAWDRVGRGWECMKETQLPGVGHLGHGRVMVCVYVQCVGTEAKEVVEQNGNGKNGGGQGW